MKVIRLRCFDFRISTSREATRSFPGRFYHISWYAVLPFRRLQYLNRHQLKVDDYGCYGTKYLLAVLQLSCKRWYRSSDIGFYFAWVVGPYSHPTHPAAEWTQWDERACRQEEWGMPKGVIRWNLVLDLSKSSLVLRKGRTSKYGSLKPWHYC